ncbi:hypothetical protein B0H10DRAFT_1289845 [Mycena sp. CBHHK59/15]|nr:hypothetical protein B0H10DRAFT_1289845 [Mycena sp. CBHHK59/15]
MEFTAPKPQHKDAIAAFKLWFEEQTSKSYLDTARFCWPEVQLAMEAKLSNLYNAILQELVYMRQQRRTQPWLRSVIGMVITTKEIGILRADSLGVEQSTFQKDSSRGVLDIVRICSGLARSTAIHRGQHEAFHLHDTTTLALPHLKPSSPDPFIAKEAEMKYTHRTVRFITLKGNRVHYPKHETQDVTFYVHSLLQDNGSLIGRCPRIFCVSREVGGDGATRSFIGPYALKTYYADHESECYKEDLIAVARQAQVKKLLLPTAEWRYGDALSMRGFTADVVGKYTDNHVIPNVVSKREEVFALSDMKRVLAQSSDYAEFSQAFVDFAEAIASLAENGLAHRDLSIGNVLLSRDVECPPTFFAEAASSVQEFANRLAVFSPREPDDRVGGILHDMDMAGRLRPSRRAKQAPVGDDWLKKMIETAEVPAASSTAQPVVPQRGFRTGTPPFMAIQLLINGPPHTVTHDLHSLLFVACLFFWTFPCFVEIPFPGPVPLTARPWPTEVLRWANRPVSFNLKELGGIKRTFFSHPADLNAIFKRTLEDDLWLEDVRYLTLFWELYRVLWAQPTEQTPDETHDKANVDPKELITALETAAKL